MNWAEGNNSRAAMNPHNSAVATLHPSILTARWILELKKLPGTPRGSMAKRCHAAWLHRGHGILIAIAAIEVAVWAK